MLRIFRLFPEHKITDPWTSSVFHFFCDFHAGNFVEIYNFSPRPVQHFVKLARTITHKSHDRRIPQSKIKQLLVHCTTMTRSLPTARMRAAPPADPLHLRVRPTDPSPRDWQPWKTTQDEWPEPTKKMLTDAQEDEDMDTDDPARMPESYRRAGWVSYAVPILNRFVILFHSKLSMSCVKPIFFSDSHAPHVPSDGETGFGGRSSRSKRHCSPW